MSDVLLVARCALALVFALAAIGKLADLAGFRRSLAEFAVPSRLRGGAAIGLPAAELAVAGLLIPAPTARLGAACALALLLGFCAAIAGALARGERPDCNCFGRAHSTRIGSAALARNAALGGVAALVIAAGAGTGIGEALARVDAPLWAILLGAGLAVQAWFSWQLFRQHGRLIERVRTLEASADESRPAQLAVIHRHSRPQPSVEERVRALAG